VRVFRRFCLLVALLGLGIAVPALQAQAPPDPALIARFAATTDTERATLLAANPQLGTTPARRALFELGIEQARLGESQAAEVTFRSVIWLGDQQGSATVRAMGLINLVRVYGERGDYAKAIEMGTEALVIAEREQDLLSQQSGLANLAIIQRRMGDFDGALASFNRALTMAYDLKRQDVAARALNNIGLVYADLGNLALAHDYLSRAQVLKMPFDDGGPGTQDIARTIINIGKLFEEQGDYAQAIRHYQQAEEMSARSGGGTTLNSSISNIGHAYMAMGEDDLARQNFMRALPVAVASGDRPREAALLHLFGSLSRNAGRLDEAESYQLKSLAIREQLGEPIPLVESLTELSRLAARAGRHEQSLAYAERAVTIATERHLLGRLWEAQLAAGQSQLALGKNAEALALYQASIATIESLRAQTTGGDRARQLYLGNRLGPYYALARLHAKSGRTFEAFMAIEHARARTLLDILAGGRQATRSLTEEQRQVERRLSQAVVSLSSQIDVEAGRLKPNTARLATLKAELAKARLDREAFIAALYDAKPDLRIARGDAPEVTREALAALVPAGTAIVSFVLEEEHAWVYLVTGGPKGPEVQSRQLAISGAALTREATRFAEQVGGRDLGFSVSARKLYDTLFVSSGLDKALAGVSNLIVIPDGALWRVPFQALQTPRGVFVVEERAVSYAHSVSALASLSHRRATRPARAPFLLALGDPETAAETKVPAAARGTVARLPEAAREVRELGRLYGAEHSKVLVSAEATETALRAQLGTASVVHVATHGVLDDSSPMYSHLRLAPGTTNEAASDGRLEAWEVMDLGIAADLAVLSACQTARGGSGEGEGVVGLSWSLLAAGASTTVVSLWEVDSASTTQLMIGFHEQLLSTAQPRTSAQALRGAARQLMKAPAYRHPFYWAGFVAVGAP
jgi:CHAT domain-containing protein/Tfp pilus assembly protein PilF